MFSSLLKAISSNKIFFICSIIIPMVILSIRMGVKSLPFIRSYDGEPQISNKIEPKKSAKRKDKK